MQAAVLWISSIVVVLLANTFVHGGAVPSEQNNSHNVEKRQAYGITNYEINESLKRLDKTVRGLENKLSRHEYREAQVADFSTKTLNALNNDHAMAQKNMQTVARQLVKMEDKILSLEQLVKTTDERQRHQFTKLSNDVLKMNVQIGFPKPPELPPHPNQAQDGDLGNQVKKILKKAIAIDSTLKNNLRRVDASIKSVGDSLNRHMNQVKSKISECGAGDHFKEVTQNLARTGELFAHEVSEAKHLLKEAGGGSCNGLDQNIEDKLDDIKEATEDQEKELATFSKDAMKALTAQQHDLNILVNETKTGREYMEHSFSAVMRNLEQLAVNSNTQMEGLEGSLRSIVEHSERALNESVQKAAQDLKIDTNAIINGLDDIAAQSENMQSSIGDYFHDLTVEIRSLKKVEQVMLNTADAVLDTKRSIEFGIQQIILELSEIVRTSGNTINSTLSDQINAISFNILKNQTSALTNMTQRMEEEIGQVWKQLGIMYQQVSTSVHLLDEIQSSTSQHQNASLSKVGKVDGTVGKINEKVAGVEDNLNYLLGRLSLVVSEFSQMKSGVGYELEKLREMTKEFSQKDIIEYQVEPSKK